MGDEFNFLDEADGDVEPEETEEEELKSSGMHIEGADGEEEVPEEEEM